LRPRSTSGDWIGQRAGPIREKASAERIAAFRRAVGASPGDSAPPTFMTTLRAGEFEIFQRLGIPLSSLLHAEQQYRLLAPIMAGDELEFETILANAVEKRGSAGALHFLTLDTRVAALREGAPVPVGTCRSTIVYRELPQGDAA
jgi:hypothetical protein